MSVLAAPELVGPVPSIGPAAIREAAARSLAGRRRKGAFLHGLTALAAAVALIPLVWLIAYTVIRGAGALSADFFLHSQRPEGIPGGGISNALIGTLVVDGLALVMAVPVGLLVALFLSSGKGRLRWTIRFGANLLAGVPSIVIGLFAYIVVVAPLRHFSAWSGSFALAVLMLPVLIRSDEEALNSVPRSLTEAGLALGAPQGKVVRAVVVRSAVPGLVTGNLLALARAVGETAPLLFTALGSQLLTLSPAKPMSTMPLLVFIDGTQPFADLQRQAWGTALVLLTLVLLLSLTGRALAHRFTRRSA